MSRRSRRNHSPAFRAKVALAAGLGHGHQLHPDAPRLRVGHFHSPSLLSRKTNADVLGQHKQKSYVRHRTDCYGRRA